MLTPDGNGLNTRQVNNAETIGTSQLYLFNSLTTYISVNDFAPERPNIETHYCTTTCISPLSKSLDTNNETATINV